MSVGMTKQELGYLCWGAGGHMENCWGYFSPEPRYRDQVQYQQPPQGGTKGKDTGLGPHTAHFMTLGLSSPPSLLLYLSPESRSSPFLSDVGFHFHAVIGLFLFSLSTHLERSQEADISRA